MAYFSSFTDILGDDVDEIANSQPLSLSLTQDFDHHQQGAANTPTMLFDGVNPTAQRTKAPRPMKQTGQQGEFRCVEEIDEKYRSVFTYQYFNLVQSRVLEDALYSDKSMVICAPTGSGKTVVFEMAIVQLLMELEDKGYTGDFKIIYMAPVKALCTERLTEWYSKFTKLGLLCIEVTGDTDVDFSQLKPYRIIITTPEKWDILTRRWRDHRGLVEDIKLFLIDEVHILNDASRGPVLEAVVSRMKTVESSAQSAHRIEQLQKQYQDNPEHQVLDTKSSPPRMRFVAVSATINNPEDVATWLGTSDKPAVFYKFGDECRPVKLQRIVEGYPCTEGTSIFKFDIILNYKLWPIIQKYHDGKPTLIFCNTRKSVALTADTLARELTIRFTPEQNAKLTALASTIKNKKLQSLVLSGVGCHHAGLLYEERHNIEQAFRNRDLPILITTTTLAMGVNLPAHLVIIKNTQQYVNGAYQEYSISTVLQMVGRAGRPQFDTEATAVIMTRLVDKPRYQALVTGNEPLQSYLHKRLAENLNSEVALGTVSDVAQCVQWLRSTFLYVRAARDPKWYLGLPPAAPSHLIKMKIEELCVQAMNCLETSGLLTMDQACFIESTEAGRLMSIYYLDLQTMKHLMKIDGSESLERLLLLICESHELADMHLRMDERRCLNALNRNTAAATVRFPMKGKISTRQMKLNCLIQAVLGCLPIPDPSLNQEAMKIMRIAHRVCQCLVAYITRPDLVSKQTQFYTAVLNSVILKKSIEAHLWENSIYVSKQLKGIGLTFSTLLATAGKVNFIVLEESHPRDLERIMNKGAPAGNVIRKQVSLLPKYRLTMTPVDEKNVSIQLILLNQAHLAENLDHLTAGEHHKCHVVVGDSENHLLLVTSFKDKDLISVYDGTMTYNISRKHNFEHKILAHCVSTTFVGIDAQCEYVFKNLEPLHYQRETDIDHPAQDTSVTKTAQKQTNITDVYKVRKRKNNDDITQSKEKKKRDNALVKQLQQLRDSFGMASKELKDDLYKSTEMSNKILLESFKSDKSTSAKNTKAGITKTKDDENVIILENNNNVRHENEYPEMTIEDVDCDSFMVDERFDSILNEIKNDISKSSNADFLIRSTDTEHIQKDTKVPSTFFENPSKTEMLNRVTNANSNQYTKTSHIPSIRETKKRKSNIKSNYSFIDELEKKIALSDNEDLISNNDGGFSNTIKSKMDKFLQKAHNITDQHDNMIVKQLIDLTTESPHSEMERKDTNLEDISMVEENQKETMENKTLKHHYINYNDIYNTQNVADLNEGEINEQMTEYNQAEFKSPHKSRCFEDTMTETDQDYVTGGESSVDLIKKHNNNLNESIQDDELSLTHHQDIIKAIGNTRKYETNINPKKESSRIKHQNNLNLIKSKDSACNRTYACDKNEIASIITATSLENEFINIDFKTADNQIGKSCDKDLRPCEDGKPTNTLEIAKPYKTNETRIKNTVYPIIKKDITDLNSSNARIAILNDSPIPQNYMRFERPSVGHLNSNSIFNNSEYLNNNKTLDIRENCTADFGVSFTDSALHTFSAQIPWPYHTSNNKLEPHGDSTSRPENDEKVSSFNVNGSTQSQSKSETPSLTTSIQRLPSNSKVLAQDIDKIRNNEYMNEYSFTATKIDVCTKSTPEHQFRIIRKLKLNVDVTEIVSRSKTKAHNNESEQSNETSNMKAGNLDIQTSLSVENSDSKPVGEKHYKNVQTLLPVEYKLPNSIKPDQKKDNNNRDSEVKQIVNKECAKEESTVSKPEQINDDHINPELDKSWKENRSTNVENVLEKYRTIISNNNNRMDNNIDIVDLDKYNETKSKHGKLKRPYKIRDIHNLDITLPKTLKVETSCSPRPTNDTILAQIRSKQSIEDNNRNYRPIDNFKTLQNNLKDSNIEVIHEEIPECPIPIENLLTEDSNSPTQDIDQSMFDPKTLLRYCSIEPNNIIPPPLEFCDRESVYSPAQDMDFIMDETTQENYTELTRSPEIVNEGLENNTLERGYDTSIFEENSQNTLTPSKEIETWTFSRDEIWEPSALLSTKPIKSCTVMRKNSPRNNTLLSTQNDARLDKLGHFKYTRKQKLRM